MGWLIQFSTIMSIQALYLGFFLHNVTNKNTLYSLYVDGRFLSQYKTTQIMSSDQYEKCLEFILNVLLLPQCIQCDF